MTWCDSMRGCDAIDRAGVQDIKYRSLGGESKDCYPGMVSGQQITVNQTRTEQSKADRGSSPRYSRCRCSYPSSCQQQSVGGMERVLVLNHQLMANEVKKVREIDR